MRRFSLRKVLCRFAHFTKYYAAFDDIREVAHAYPPLSDAIKAQQPQDTRRFAHFAKYYVAFDGIREIARIDLARSAPERGTETQRGKNIDIAP